MDEVGRGTSTYDGLSLAWSIIEYLLDEIKAKTLFATHYHELNNLKKENNLIKNYNILVNEDDREVLFLHKIVEGGTDKSYGIHVAKLAGLPNKVIKRAVEIMNNITDQEQITNFMVKEYKDKKIVEQKEESNDRSTRLNKKTEDSQKSLFGFID